MTDSSGKDNLVLFPKTLDYYQIQLTKMLETEGYGDAKALLNFLLQCHGEAERHHTEWQALLGWLDAAFPEVVGGKLPDGLELVNEEEDQSEESWIRRKVEERHQADSGYVPQLLSALSEGGDPQQWLLVLGQLLHLSHPDIEPVLREWLARAEYIPPVQFRTLQVLRKQGAAGPVFFRRDGEMVTVEAEDTPASFADFPQSIHQVLERVRQTAEVSDPTLLYFAEEMWKECVEVAYGTQIYKSMTENDDSAHDLWAAALHQLLLEKLHGKQGDEWTKEQYGITGEIRFRYEQALRWLRLYSVEPRMTFQ